MQQKFDKLPPQSIFQGTDDYLFMRHFVFLSNLNTAYNTSRKGWFYNSNI